MGKGDALRSLKAKVDSTSAIDLRSEAAQKIAKIHSQTVTTSAQDLSVSEAQYQIDQGDLEPDDRKKRIRYASASMRIDNVGDPSFSKRAWEALTSQSKLGQEIVGGAEKAVQKVAEYTPQVASGLGDIIMNLAIAWIVTNALSKRI